MGEEGGKSQDFSDFTPHKVMRNLLLSHERKFNTTRKTDYGLRKWIETILA